MEIGLPSFAQNTDRQKLLQTHNLFGRGNKTLCGTPAEYSVGYSFWCQHWQYWLKKHRHCLGRGGWHWCIATQTSTNALIPFSGRKCYCTTRPVISHLHATPAWTAHPSDRRYNQNTVAEEEKMAMIHSSKSYDSECEQQPSGLRAFI